MSYLDQITVGSTTYDLQDSGAQRVTLTGTSAPTTSTVGVVGQHYINTTATGHPYEYVCTAVSSGTYTWIPVDASEAPVTSVNSKTGAVVLDKTDIGLGNVANVAQYSASNPPPYPVTSVNGSTGAVTVSVPSAATATPSDLGTAAVGTSTKWAKEDHVHKMPSASDVGALPSSTVIPSKVSDLTNDSGFVNASGAAAAAPVQSVNGKTGAVTVVEDDQTWNGVSLAKQSATNTGDSTYVPLATSLTPVNMSFTPVKKTPTANAIAKYDNSSYLYSTTPSDNDNSTKVATTAYVDSAIDDLPEPMVFKGSLGTGGTITTLPAASSSNTGFTYKVITDGTYASQAAKVGDTFISDGTAWVLIPSGDEPSGTVTSVGVSNATNGGLSVSGSPITSSGTITIGHSNILSSAQTTQAVYPIKIDKNGHISAYGSAVSIPSKTSDLTNDSGFVNSSQAASAAPVQSVNGKMGDVVIDIKDDPQFAALVGFTSTGSSGVTQKDALGTKIMNKISAAKTASQLGFFYDATEDEIHLYLLFALQTSSNKRKFYRIVKYSDQQEPLTLEGGVGITVKEISIPANDQKIYTVRFNIQNPSSRADRKYASVRLAVVVYDDNDNEIERYYGAQYFYAYDDVTGTVSRTIYSNIERGPSDFIIDIGLKNNTNAAMGNYTTYIVGDTLSDGLSPIVATNQPTGFDLVIPDSFFDNAPFGYSIAAILGDFTRIYGPTVYKAEGLTKDSVGLGNVANERQYSAENPPPYPVTSVNGSTGAVTVAVPSAATATPSNLGTAAVGTSTKYAKEDHVHNYPDVVHVGSSAPSDSNIELWLDNSSGGGSIVTSVNGSTGAVAITASGLGISDYITERGTSGDWTYIKYASKKFEAWCLKSVLNKASENSVNSWYWTREYLTPPSFTATIECALANAHWGTGVAWGNVRSAGSSSIEVLIFGNQSTGNLSVRCEIRGTYT